MCDQLISLCNEWLDKDRRQVMEPKPLTETRARTSEQQVSAHCDGCYEYVAAYWCDWEAEQCVCDTQPSQPAVQSAISNQQQTISSPTSSTFSSAISSTVRSSSAPQQVGITDRARAVQAAETSPSCRRMHRAHSRIIGAREHQSPELDHRDRLRCHGTELRCRGCGRALREHQHRSNWCRSCYL